MCKAIVGEGLKNPEFVERYNQIVNDAPNPTVADLHRIINMFTEHDPVEAEEEIPLDIQLECTLFPDAKIPFISIVLIC